MKETMDAAEFILRGAEAIAKSLEDGKISFMDLPSFVPVLGLASAAVEGVKEIPSELKSMTEDDKKMLFKVIETLDLENPDHEAIGEEILKVATSVMKLVFMIQDARKK